MIGSDEYADAMKKMASIKEGNVIEVYDSMANVYDVSVFDAGYKNPDRAFEVFMQLKLPKESYILDLACGTGYLGRKLQKQGYCQLTGIDGSSKMLQKAEESKCYAELIQEMIGVGKYPLSLYGKFDAVIAAGMFSKDHVSPEGAEDIV